MVIDVHAKNVVLGFAEQNILDKGSFEWTSQLRYDWEADDTDSENIWVKCMQTRFPYGYEYLGDAHGRPPPWGVWGGRRVIAAGLRAWRGGARSV